MATFLYGIAKGSRRALLRNILLLIPGIAMLILLHLALIRGEKLVNLVGKLTWAYLASVVILISNSVLMALMERVSRSEKSRNHPLKALFQGLQVALFFIGGIVVIAILVGKSPKVLLTGLGASAAVLMLVFKDSILGFVAGVQLSQNNMVRIGDWIQMTDGSANGTVEEITLNTVKVRNWDNTITMIPPYTLVSVPFKNWRGMQESGGRRADKCIVIDMNTLVVCTDDMIERIRTDLPLMAQSKEDSAVEILTNIQLYRLYIERYLRQHPDVNQDLDIIVTQKEATPYGLPIQVYFFTRDKVWAVYERKQSDIFDHLMTVAPDFDLRIYQRP